MDLSISEQWTADGGHGFVLWRGRVPFPVVYPTREQAEHAKSMVERGVAFETVPEEGGELWLTVAGAAAG